MNFKITIKEGQIVPENKLAFEKYLESIEGRQGSITFHSVSKDPSENQKRYWKAILRFIYRSHPFNSFDSFYDLEIAICNRLENINSIDQLGTDELTNLIEKLKIWLKNTFDKEIPF